MNKCQREFEKYCDKYGKAKDKFEYQEESTYASYDTEHEYIVFQEGWKAAKADTKTKKVKKNAT